MKGLKVVKKKIKKVERRMTEVFWTTKIVMYSRITAKSNLRRRNRVVKSSAIFLEVSRPRYIVPILRFVEARSNLY